MCIRDRPKSSAACLPSTPIPQPLESKLIIKACSLHSFINYNGVRFGTYGKGALECLISRLRYLNMGSSSALAPSARQPIHHNMDIYSYVQDLLKAKQIDKVAS